MNTLRSNFVVANLFLFMPHNNFHFFSVSRRDLVNKEVLFTTQLEQAEKQAVTSQAKADDLAYQLNELERNLTVKTWNVERKLNIKHFIGIFHFYKLATARIQSINGCTWTNVDRSSQPGDVRDVKPA